MRALMSPVSLETVNLLFYLNVYVRLDIIELTSQENKMFLDASKNFSLSLPLTINSALLGFVTCHYRCPMTTDLVLV